MSKHVPVQSQPAAKLIPASLVLAAALAVAPVAHAATYTWSVDANGNWNAPASWGLVSGFPNGVDDVANIDFNITASRTVTQNVNAVSGAAQITVGTIYFRDTDNTHVFTLSGQPVRMEVSTGRAVIESGSSLSNNRHVVSTALQLASDLELRATVGELRISNISEIGGVKNVVKTGAGTVNVFGNWAHTGSTTVSAPDTANPASLDRPTLVRGLFSYGEPSGFSSATSGFILENSELRMGSTRDTLVNRLPDSASIEMATSTLRYDGDLASTTLRNVRETFGTLTLANGFNTFQTNFVSVTGYQQVSELVGSSLTRGDGRATVLIRGNKLGSSDAGGNALGSSRMFLDTDPTGSLVGGGGAGGSTTISILPYAIGASSISGADTFVTYDSTATVVNGINGDSSTARAGKIGFRPLNTSTEFVTALSGASTTTNVRRTSNETLAGAATANALILAGNSTLTLNGGLTLASGALLYNGSSNQLGTITGAAGTTLATASGRELVVHVVNTSTSGTTTSRTRLNIDQIITAAGGLTFGALNLGNNGPQNLILSRENTYAGQTTINSGILTVTSTGTLGTGNVVVRNAAWLEQQTATAVADAASVTIDGGGLAVLDFTGSDVIASLTLGGTLYTTAGTYGGPSSGADFIYSNYFSGTGTYEIVPEPASLSLLGMAAAGLLRRRRAS